jgi:hypothetical protein
MMNLRCVAEGVATTAALTHSNSRCRRNIPAFFGAGAFLAASGSKERAAAFRGNAR